jgi:hypothetical protein
MGCGCKNKTTTQQQQTQQQVQQAVQSNSKVVSESIKNTIQKYYKR